MYLLSLVSHALRNASVRLMTISLCRSLSMVSLIALFCLIATPSLAVSYTDNGDGTVTDPNTGLVWMRCSMGQTWTGSTCSGTASSYSGDQANALTGAVNFAGQGDWRVPTIRELQTIVDRSHYGPAIDSSIFPATPSSIFWTSSAYVGASSIAWIVYFDGGYTSHSFRSVNGGGSVRLVRAGQSFDSLLNLARPTTDYVDHGNGTVTDILTGLMWQRCTKGETWTGSTCSGSAMVYLWNQAKALTDSFASYTDWRLPTVDELLTLVDYTIGVGSINHSIFPETTTTYYYSSSPYVNSSGGAWGVSFETGSLDPRDGFYLVRLVRKGESLGTFALTVSNIGNGSISSNPSGISCGSTCSASFISGSSVTLTATPASGSTFSGWSGVCTGTGGCDVSMTAAMNVTATFALNEAATTTTTTTVTTTTTTTLVPDGSLAFAQGWNLLGNGSETPIDVATTFSDSNRFVTVWKWISTQSVWAFHAPALAAQGGTVLADYVTSKGYQLLTTIAGGEGYWVNAKQSFSMSPPNGTLVVSTSFQEGQQGALKQGWNLVSVGTSKTPAGFNTDVGTSPPSAGVVPNNITSLWAWDSTQAKWYFYAPSLEAQGGTTLSDYITSKGYLNFTTTQKTLGPGIGFWVNKQ